MAVARKSEFVVSRAEGVWVWDTSGKRYLDATASLWYANIGHGRGEMADAAAAQMRRLDAYSTFGDFANEPALELCARLSDLAPMPDARVFLTSGGGDAIDTAAKLARLYWSIQGAGERVHIIGRTNAYHGTHGYGTSIGGIEANRVGWGPLATGMSLVSYDSVEALEAEVKAIGPERVAAFFVEPVVGAGGVLPPPAGYIEAAAELCRAHGILLVVDSVICGFGRLGTWWGIERWGVEPDMITFAKGVTSGYLPLGGVVISDAVAAPFWTEPGAYTFRHGPTYAGHPTCCAAALTNLEILEREKLIPRGRELEGALLGALAHLADHDGVAEVRGGLGLLAAVEIDPEVLRRVPTAVAEVQRRARDAGVLVRPLGSSVAVSPPLIIEESELEMIGDALATAFDGLSGAT
ncbi:MAG: aminotransferase class III-fold pyridoxal phosphate-dependent enzyme [Streptosporangiales bacterium]|nr:aminotransferase class III-fold pyridoxal phosphate-dependent enzyme [Streptosporangiales bacterium]